MLEVAAAGRSSVYIEELSGGVNDCGFVERRVCDSYKDIDEFIDSYNKQNQHYKFVPNKGGITIFNSYDKPYFNQEGKIVSNLLAQIITDSSNIKLDFLMLAMFYFTYLVSLVGAISLIGLKRKPDLLTLNIEELFITVLNFYLEFMSQIYVLR